MTEQHNDINHWRRLAKSIKAYNENLITRARTGQITTARWQELEESSMSRYIYAIDRIKHLKDRVFLNKKHDIDHWKKMINRTKTYMYELEWRKHRNQISWEYYQELFDSAKYQLYRFYQNIEQILILFQKPPGITIHKSQLQQLCDNLPGFLQSSPQPSTPSPPQPLP